MHAGEAPRAGRGPLRFPPPLVPVAFIAAGAAYHVAEGAPPATPVATLLGWSIAAGAAGLIVWAAITLLRVGTPVEPWKATTSIVGAGPYKWTRNPMYLGLVSGQLGIGVATGWWLVALLAPMSLLLLHFLAIKPEERYLEQNFGKAYLEYKVRVRRWL